MVLRFLVCGLLLSTTALGQLNYDKPYAWSVPDRVRERFEKERLFEKYNISEKVNPFYLRGDFDGDNVPDYAVFVENRNTHHFGIAIVQSKSPAIEILGASGNRKLRNGTGNRSYAFEDFDWMDSWQVQRKTKLEIDEREDSDPHPGPMLGEAIMAKKSESASGLIYWDGRRWRWYQLDD